MVALPYSLYSLKSRSILTEAVERNLKDHECLDSSICSKYALLRSALANPPTPKSDLMNLDSDNSDSSYHRMLLGQSLQYRDNQSAMTLHLTEHSSVGTSHLHGDRDGIKYEGFIKWDQHPKWPIKSLENERENIVDGSFHGSDRAHRGRLGEAPSLIEAKSLTGYINIGQKTALVHLNPVPCPSAQPAIQPSCSAAVYPCTTTFHLKISVFCPPFVPPPHSRVWYKGEEYKPSAERTGAAGTIFVPGHGWLPLAGNDDFPACSQV